MVGYHVDYKEIPKINPKSNENVKYFLCSLCGSAVVNRKIHTHWHMTLSNNNDYSFFPFWEGIDDV